jgi:hypothetical protein
MHVNIENAICSYVQYTSAADVSPCDTYSESVSMAAAGSRGIFHGVFSPGFLSKRQKVFNEHYDMVRELVPKERLLVVWVLDGWEPLCNFLGCDILRTPFPNGNTAPDIHDKAKQFVWWEIIRATKILACGMPTLFIFLYCVSLLLGWLDLVWTSYLVCYWRIEEKDI